VPTVAISCPPRGPFDPTSGYYSQFYEDYTLAYVFRDTKHGTYVDVGANDPDNNNVTKYFYLLGWRGVNIEPNPDMLTRLKKARPEDVNLGLGISDTPGVLKFYRFGNTYSGLSTFDRSIALQYKKTGLDFDELEVPVSTLQDVLEKNTLLIHGFTFLNVDVEGFEQHVLSSVDLKQQPATVVMVEATAPDTEHATYQHWEPLLSAAGYLFAMDDGLNRYYVARTHRDLLTKFAEVNYCVETDKISKSIKLNGFLNDDRP
jgi:FkbM family methyltransferase